MSVHAWLSRYLAEGVAGLADRSHRPRSCPHQAGESVTVLVAELRRQHPRWGAKRIRFELLKNPPDGMTVPSASTLNRILVGRGWWCNASGNGRGNHSPAGSGRGRCSCGSSTSSAG